MENHLVVRKFYQTIHDYVNLRKAECVAGHTEVKL